MKIVLVAVLCFSLCQASPRIVNRCLTARECEGAKLYCPLGYQKDHNGCVRSCQRCKQRGYFESDILVKDDESYKLLDHDYRQTSSGRHRRSAYGQGIKEWPRVGNVVEVPFVLDRMDTSSRRILDAAIEEFRQKTCVRLVKRRTQKNFVQFRGVGSCSSHIGKRGGRQEIFLGAGCKSKGVAIHEIMHALGFWHEQSRGDRDKYINIQWDNVIEGERSNFLKRAVNWDSYGSSYDLDSVMQYGGFYLSKGAGLLPTIVNVRDNSPVQAQRSRLSVQDALQINRKYKCRRYLPEKSRGKQPVRQPKTTAKPMTTTTAKPCQDYHHQCAYFKSKNYCSMSQSVGEDLCPKTCQTCTDVSSEAVARDAGSRKIVAQKFVPKCEDKNRLCNYWSRDRGLCKKSKYFLYMKLNCKKSCNFC